MEYSNVQRVVESSHGRPGDIAESLDLLRYPSSLLVYNLLAKKCLCYRESSLPS